MRTSTDRLLRRCSLKPLAMMERNIEWNDGKEYRVGGGLEMRDGGWEEIFE